MDRFMTGWLFSFYGRKKLAGADFDYLLAMLCIHSLYLYLINLKQIKSYDIVFLT